MPSRILLADDSLTIRKVVELTFSGSEFELKAVGNGDEAVALLDEYAPDVVLADAVMPGKTGYEVCEEVKRRGPFVPVVLLTGTFEPFDKPRSERSGADAVVTKPFDSQGLATLVRDLVRKAADAKAAAPPPPPPAPEPPPPPPSFSEQAEITDPTLGSSAFYTAPLPSQEPPPPPPSPLEDAFATTAIPVFTHPAPDLPTEPVAPVSPSQETKTPSGFEMDLAALDDAPEPQRRDLDEDIAAFEASDQGRTRRSELWDQVPAAAAAEPPPAPSDLEALAAEASLTDLKSLIPDAGPVASAAPLPMLSDADVDRVARRLLELGGERVVRRIAWDVVPELAERLVKERLEELEKAD